MALVSLRDLRQMLVVGLARVVSCLPPRYQEPIARTLGDLTYLCVPGRRRATTAGISVGLRGSPGNRRVRQVAREVLRQKAVEQIVSLTSGLRQGASVDGLDYLQAALEKGRGAILLDCPFGNRLLGKAILRDGGFAITQVHDDAHWSSSSWLGRCVVRRVNRALEGRFLAELVDIEDDSLAYLKLLVERLGQNGIICTSAFGEQGRRFVSVDFLGRRRRFPTGPMSLARLTGAPLVPMFCFTDADSRHRLVLEPPLEGLARTRRDDGLVAAITDYARLVERYVYEFPGQWYMWHSRDEDPAAGDQSPAGMRDEGTR